MFMVLVALIFSLSAFFYRFRQIQLLKSSVLKAAQKTKADNCSGTKLVRRQVATVSMFSGCALQLNYVKSYDMLS